MIFLRNCSWNSSYYVRWQILDCLTFWLIEMVVLMSRGVCVCVFGGSEATLESVLDWASAGVLFRFILSIIVSYIYWSITSVLPSAGWLPLTLRLMERKTTCGLGSPSLRELLSLFSAQAQLKPSPAPFGLWDARIGSVMPLPSGPRPDPGVQPILCSIRFPTFDSGRGAALSPTTPERDTEKGIICIKL